MKNLPTIFGLVKIAAFSVLAVAATGNYARAADINFLCANALEPAMRELIPEFQKASGHNVTVIYVTPGISTERVRKGEEADLVTVLPPQWESLQKEGKLAPGTRVVIGKSGLGVFVKRGVPRPDISSVEAFKRALLNAPSIAVGDPSHSPVGGYVIPLLDRLGIGGDIKPKLKLTGGGPAAIQTVVKGDAVIGFTQMPEIIASPDVESVGPVPTDIQNFTTFTAAIPASAKQAAAAKALVDFLTSPRAVSVIKSKGLEAG
jgi:molybdate transport system substrate-binding protein